MIIMRRILVDRSRARGTAKRGNAPVHVNLDEAPQIASDSGDRDIAAIDAALAALGEFDPRKEKVVELRFFRRTERGRNGRRTPDFSAKRDARLEAGQGVAVGRIATLNADGPGKPSPCQ